MRCVNFTACNILSIIIIIYCVCDYSKPHVSEVLFYEFFRDMLSCHYFLYFYFTKFSFAHL